MSLLRPLLLFLAIACASTGSGGPPGPPGTQVMATTTPGGVSIQVLSPYTGAPVCGVVPLVVQIKNPTGKPSVWNIGSTSNSALRRSFEVSCPPGESLTKTVLFPVGVTADGSYYGYDNYLMASSGDARCSGSIGESYGNSSSYPRVIVGIKASFKLQTGVQNQFQFDTGLASTDWRAYQGFAAVLISGGEWEALAPGQKLALTTWAKSGGSLLVDVGYENRTAASLGLPPNDVSPNNDHAYGLGSIQILQLPSNAQFDPTKYSRPHPDSILSDNNSPADVIREWSHRSPDLARGRSSGGLSILMVLVAVAFAVVVGPVNLFVIAPARRRHRLFFSVPIISAAAGLLLTLAVVIGDGIGGKGERFLLVENRPGELENTNHTIQYQTSKCGVLFSTGFTTEGSVFLYRLPDVDSTSGYSSRNDGGLGLKLSTDKLEATGGWFGSRSSQHFRLLGVEPSRGRIEVSGENEASRLTSSFDFPIDELFYTTDGKQWWQAKGLKQGEPTGVSSISDSDVESRLRGFLTNAPRELNDRVVSLRKRPMHFVALTSKPPAIPTHKAIDWTDHGVITGPVLRP